MPNRNIVAVERLVNNFSSLSENITRPTTHYGEADVRSDFIDPFFRILGWDMANEAGLPRSLREVIREDSFVDTDERSRRPDYALRIAGQRKFFVEAKKPAVDIRTDANSAFQIRRYGWSANLPISIITNFKCLRIYNTTFPPNPEDDVDTGLVREFLYTGYIDNFDQIYSLISRESAGSELFYENFEIDRAQGIPVNNVFLERINRWRVALAEDLFSRYRIDETELNDIVQKVINRIIFIRMCEDRGIESENILREFAREMDFVRIRDLFRRMDRRYDSGLFDINSDPFQENYEIDSSLFQNIVNDVYLPNAPYTFAVLDSDFLGQVYELFLTKKLHIDQDQVLLMDKPIYEDREIVTTTQVIVDRLTQKTISKCVNERREGRPVLPVEELYQLKVLDLAAGSGRFLIKAFDFLIEEAINYYSTYGHHGEIFERAVGDWQLCFERKREILECCLFGIDIDFNAVEVARFSLLIKLLEDQNYNTLPSGRAILPNVNPNIIWGNAVVDDRFFCSTEEQYRQVLPLNWENFFSVEQFDVVVGNPPYLKTEDMRARFPDELEFYKTYYETPYKQFDKYFVFLEKAIQKIRSDGWIGMIVPNKWITIEAGKNLRKLLSCRGLIAEIVNFGSEQVFRGRSVYNCLLIMNRGGRETVGYSFVNNFAEWAARTEDDMLQLPVSMIQQYNSAAWVFPNDELENLILQGLFLNSARLSDICRIFNGLQTSAEKVFAISCWTEFEPGLIRFEKEGQEWVIEKEITKPYLTDENLVRSFKEVSNDSIVIFPYYYNERGSAIVYRPEELLNYYPRAYEYLQAYRERLISRDVRPVPPHEEFYHYGRSQSLSVAFSAPKIVACVNQRGDKYGIDYTGIGIASGGTAGEIGISEPIQGYSLLFILSVINFKGVEFYCRRRGSPFRGGWYARGTAVISDVPVPLIDFDTENEKKQLHDEVVEYARNILTLNQSIENHRISERESEILSRRILEFHERVNRLLARLYQIEEYIDRLSLD